MLLTDDIIFEQLQTAFTAHHHKVSGELCLTSPMIYDGSMMLPNHIYIVTPAQLAFLRVECADILILCAGSRAFQATNFPYDLILLEERIDSLHLLNHLTGIFDYFHHWENQLNECSNDFNGIQSMLQISSRILGGTLVLTDIYYNILAYSDGFLKMSEYVDPLSSHRSSSYAIETLTNDPVAQALQYEKKLFIYPYDSSPESSLCCNLFRKDETIYYNRLILITEDHCYTASHYRLLRYLAERVDKISSRLSTLSLALPTYVNLKSLMKNMLMKDPQNKSIVASSLQAVSWQSSDRYKLFVFYPFIEGYRPGASAYFANQLEQLFSETCAFPVDDTIVMIQNVTRSSDDPDIARARLSEFLRENLHKVGISDIINSFFDLRSAHVQAQAAYEIGSAKDPLYWYYKFDHYIPDYIIMKSSSELPVSMLCSREFRILDEHDKKNGTQYLSTLKTYIAERYNATHAAQKLFLHRTSFLERLNRIQNLTQLDLDNWDTRLLLMFSYRAMTEEK